MPSQVVSRTLLHTTHIHAHSLLGHLTFAQTLWLSNQSTCRYSCISIVHLACNSRPYSQRPAAQPSVLGPSMLARITPAVAATLGTLHILLNVRRATQDSLHERQHCPGLACHERGTRHELAILHCQPSIRPKKRNMTPTSEHLNGNRQSHRQGKPCHGICDAAGRHSAARSAPGSSLTIPFGHRPGGILGDPTHHTSTIASKTPQHRPRTTVNRGVLLLDRDSCRAVTNSWFRSAPCRHNTAD